MTRKTAFFSLFCFLFLFSGIVGAQDTITLDTVYSDNTVFNHFHGLANSYTMAAALLDTTAANRTVSIGNLPAISPNDTKTLTYLSGWSALVPYLYAASFLPPTYPAPGALWENRPFQFNIAETGQTIAPFTIPSGTLFQMDPPNVSITGGKHPTITWGHVNGATKYRVRFYPLNSSGNPNISVLLFQTIIDDIGPGNYSYTYQGTLFETNVSLAVSVEAYDNPGTATYFFNRSRAISPYPYPVYLPLVVSSINSLVGTWNFVNCTGSCSAVPNQLVFNANGTGTASGPGGGPFTWTLSGNQLTLNPTSGNMNAADINWIDNNNFIATLVVGGNNQTTWKRA